MGAKRTAGIAFGLIIDLAARLDAAGLQAEAMPSLDEAIGLCWPLARRLAKLEKHGQRAAASAARARENVLAAAVTRWAAAPWWTWPEYQPGQWHVALLPGPSPDRDREAA